MKSELLTKEQLAEELQVSVRTVERWIAERRVPFVRLPRRGARRAVRFNARQITQWLERNTARPLSWSRTCPRLPSSGGTDEQG